MNFKIIGALCFALSGDAIITIGLIWSVLQAGGDTRVLGLFLFINTLLPYFAQRFYNARRNLHAAHPGLMFVRIRMFGALCSVGLLLLYRDYQSINILYVAASVFAVIQFLSNQYIEGYFGYLVLSKKLSANLAARIQQTSTQLSVLFGASLAGFMLKFGGFSGILVLNMLTYVLGGVAFKHFIAGHLFTHDELIAKPMPNKVRNTVNKQVVHAFIMIFSLTASLYAFNFLLPVFVQKDMGWSPETFGLIDALAALGAFTSVIFTAKHFSKRLLPYSYYFIVISLCAFYFARTPFFAVLMGFLYGLSLNTLRISLRETIFSSTQTHEAALAYGRRLALISMSCKSLAPLILGWVVASYTAMSLLCVIGVAMGLVFGLMKLDHIIHGALVFEANE